MRREGGIEAVTVVLKEQKELEFQKVCLSVLVPLLTGANEQNHFHSCKGTPVALDALQRFRMEDKEAHAFEQQPA